MPEKYEPEPIPNERLQAVAQWIQTHYQPALRFVAEGQQLEEAPLPGAFQIRQYQLEAWTKIWEARRQGEARALVHLATGLGKTSIAVFDVIKFREECATQDQPIVPRVLFVSHMNDISRQAQDRFLRFIPGLETSFFDTQADSHPDVDATFATLQALYSALHNEQSNFCIDPQNYEYIIYDEAHHTEAETFKAVREYFDPLFELALTATPDRMDARDIKKYFGAPKYSKDLAEGIAEGWLADVDYHIVFDDVVKHAMEEDFEPKNLKEFKELFRIRPRNEVIAKNIREERHRIGLDMAKTIVFCEDVEHAEEMAELLGGVPYHSGVSKGSRRDVLQSFRTGHNQIITTVDMFNEGIDIPDASLIVFLRSTQSTTVFKQQLGRGLRIWQGKRKVSVLDFVANIERIAKVRELGESIQRRAEELGEKIAEEGASVGGGGRADGMRLHSRHGDFDFNKISVDLLAKWNLLREKGPRSKYDGDFPEAPEGWLYVGKFAEAIDRSIPYILRTADALEIEGSEMIGKNGHVGLYFSPEHIEMIADKSGNVPKVPEGWLAASGLKKKHGISYRVIQAEAEKLGITGSYMRSRGRPGIFYSPDEQLRIIEARSLPEQKEGWLSATAIAENSPYSLPTIQKFIDDLHIEGTTMRNSSGHHIICYSPSQQNLISDAVHTQLSEQAPDGWLTAIGIQKYHNIHSTTVTRIAGKLGIQGTRKKGYLNREGTYYTPSEIQAILKQAKG